MQQQMYQTLSTNQQQQPQAAIPDLNNTIQDIQENIEENLDEKEFVTTYN